MMDEGDAVRQLSRSELRKQKLMEYLAAKGKLKPPNPKPYLRDDSIKHTKLEGNADKGKENQAQDRAPLRLQLAGKRKPIPSAGTRAPPTSANVLATLAPENPRMPAPSTARPVASARAKPRPHSAVPSSAAAPTAIKACSVPGKTRAHSETVVSSRNGVKTASAGRTASESQSGPQPITAIVAERTGPTTSALAKTGPVTRTQPSAPTQPRLHSARTRLNASSQFKTHSGKSAPAGTGCTRAVQPKTQPKTGHVAAISPKSVPGKASLSRGPPNVCVSAPKAPTNPTEIASKKKCYLRPSGNMAPSSAFQREAVGPTGESGPVLRSAGSEPIPSSKHAEHGSPLPSTRTVSLNKPRAEAPQIPAHQSALAERRSQPLRPNPRAAAPQRSRTGGRSLGAPARMGDDRDGQGSAALQRAVRQAVSGMRGMGRQRAASEPEGNDSYIATSNGQSPTPAPSARVTFAELPSERGLRGASEGNCAAPSTVPRPAPQTCHTLRPADLKTPARTCREGPAIIGTAPPRDRKLTAAQEERLRKLQEWRRAKGISYKRPPMPIRPQVKKTTDVSQHYWTAMEEEDEAQSVVYNIDRSLTDCIKLLQEGCPLEQVKEVLSRVPMAQKFVKYWICQARLSEREGNLEVLPLFEEAVRVVMEPVDDLRTVVFEILKKKEEALAKEAEAASEGEGKKDDSDDEEEEEAQQATAIDPVTPRAVNALIRGSKNGSSVVKYKITATPGARRSQRPEPVTLDGQELRFFTPVRRSIRIEGSAARYPAALREHDPCVASFRDLLAEEEGQPEGEEGCGSPLYVYRENEALRDRVQVQLQYSSGPDE